MVKMLLEAEKKSDLMPFAQIARKQGIVVKYVTNNPSPSGDKWFENQKNLSYLDKKIEKAKNDKHYIINEDESVREFFEKL
jgi:hypothetical protein